jgi:RNA polymerase-binding transcription factor DksA
MDSDALDPQESLDLDRVERDLADAEAALERLDAGTYFTDEVTQLPLDEAHLASNPLTRRNPS